MRTLDAPSPPRATALIVFGALVSLGALAACGSVEGTTPECVQDVDETGNQNLENGCNPFALCLNEAGERRPAAECCSGLSGPELELCLYGYGAGPAPGGVGGGGGI